MDHGRHPYADFLHTVQKPARYVGGELNQVVKDPAEVSVSLCLCFPDVYDIGMSHLGTKILYGVCNAHPQIACERAFAPWVDMEQALRERGLPVLSLETARPLHAFDVLGFSLQYEMTYTNVLTLLDLGGVPLRQVDRDEDAPLVLGGGPCATHPEAVAPFFDAFLVGDGEARLPELLLQWAADRKAGFSRRERLVRMAEAGGVYVPSLYETVTCPRSDLVVVDRPADPRVPARVERAFVEDINRFPFPDDSPVASAQAIFDRLSVEIARGCTEGCRFCQAGMIYRPVRERDPQQVIDTILSAIDKGGYDEASLTSLSTADYSCIDPLVRRIMTELRRRRVSLSVSSLRAYGLNDSLLSEIRSVRATGLTFAPEAGTQRMRDVVNKNVTEEDLEGSAHRVFSKGWSRMKLYFMIGLPTEQDEDVRGIVETAARVRRIGRRYQGRRADATASVSSHVPKPHTPFQWAAMDTIEEIRRKQRMLSDTARTQRVSVKWHDPRVSYLEGIMARGDRRVADVVEAAWRRGCRFDGWDEQLRYDLWVQAMADTPGFDPGRYLGTLPLDGRLPWDHVDMGLDDGFLAGEWKRALKSKLSPPCGKPVGSIVHPTNLKESQADPRRLVCYDCGIACDLNHMRAERGEFLSALGALEPPEAVVAPPQTDLDARGRPRPPVAEGAVSPEDMVRYRLVYAKDGLVRLQGHTDMLRILPRAMRRAGLPVGHTLGFHPKPFMSFTPALPLGTLSVGELCDIALTEALPAAEVLARLQAASDPGLTFLDARCLARSEPNCARNLHSADYLIAIPGATASEVAAAAQALLQAETLSVTVRRKQEDRVVDARLAAESARLAGEAEWPAVLGPAPHAPLLYLRLLEGMPAPRPMELVAALLPARTGQTPDVIRLGFWRLDRDGRLRRPVEVTPMPSVEAPSEVPSQAPTEVPAEGVAA